MSPGLVARPFGHVFATGDDADDVELQLHFGDRAEGAEHRCCTAHVVLHLVHAGAGLERNAAGIEGDALADQDRRRILLLAAQVLQDNKLRRLFAAVGDRQEAAHLERFQLLAVQHFDAQLKILGQLLGGVGQIGRRAIIAGQVAQVLGQIDAVGQRRRFAPRLPARQPQWSPGRQMHLFDADCGCILLALQAVEAIGVVADRQHGGAQNPGRIALLDSIQRQRQHGVGSAQRTPAHWQSLAWRYGSPCPTPALCPNRRATRAGPATPSGWRISSVLPALPEMSPDLTAALMAPLLSNACADGDKLVVSNMPTTIQPALVAAIVFFASN